MLPVPNLIPKLKLILNKRFSLLLIFVCLFLGESVFAQQNKPIQKPDSTIVEKSGKKPKYNFVDQFSSYYGAPSYSSPFYLNNLGLNKYNFSFNPEGSIRFEQSTKESKSPFTNYRIPESLPLEQYSKQQDKQIYTRMLRQYASANDGVSDVSGRGLKPKLFKSKVFDSILGQKIDLQPNGFVSVEIGGFGQNSDNPLLPIRQRKSFQFVFNQQASFNLTGGIGDLMKINTNFDTKASFNFQNQLKMNYRAQEEDIIQNVEAGNINFNLPTTLISGVSNLMGFKTSLRFGKLDVQLAASQQRSKVESIYLRGGSQAKGFEIRCDTYDENRHFFLSHFFRDNYEKWLKSMPVSLSGVNITRVEVYVTNRTGNTETLRNIAGFANIGGSQGDGKVASNKANSIYKTVYDIHGIGDRPVDLLNGEIQARGFQRGTDYELLRGAKKLTERDYRINTELGYISLLTPLKNDEVLAVSYEYTYQGQKYKVGELTEDYQGRKDDEVLFMKMLKSSTIRNNITNPMWDLMMKNVYSLNTSSIAREGFQLRIIYKDDQTGIDNPNLQEGIKTKDQPLIRILGLDRLNPQLDPGPDGNFDFIENTTVDTRFGKIIFPVLEPFGSSLRKQFDPTTEANLIEKYVFDDLYKKTLADAQQVTRKNKFFLKGNMQGGNGPSAIPGAGGSSGGGTPIQLPFGVDASTVVVSAGGVALSQGTDYVVEDGMGQLRILNQSIMSSGREIKIDYERPDLFSNQIRTMLGGRFDYNLSKDVHLGATVMKYKETPSGFLTRVAVGNEPTNNTIIGFDAGVKKQSRFITKMLDKLPLIQTKEISQIDFSGEVAQLFPGVAPRVNGNSFLDDFEGSRTVYDLARQALKWKLGAIPDAFKVNIANQYDLQNSYRRAKISAYNVDLTFYGAGGGLGVEAPSNFDENDERNVYERRIAPNDIFKGKDIQNANINFPISSFDIAYFPSERGSYNYNPNLTPDGLLKDPKSNFGAVTRAIPSDIDFDNANIEILEFWMLDPFQKGQFGTVKDGVFNKNNETGGKLEIHLGDISEDVIPDSRFNFENGITIDKNKKLDELAKQIVSPWGFAPTTQFITNAFSNDNDARAAQDIGLEGLNNEEEKSYFKKNFLDRLPANLSQAAKAQIEADPSADDYKFYFNPDFNAITDPNKKLVYRYKDALGMENNSPPSTNTGRIVLSESGSNLPDMEDLNADNTVNDIESYYKYEIDLKPDQLQVGKDFVVDMVDNGEQGKWYLMRVPIRKFKEKVGEINGFKSIRFMRMLMTDFAEPVVLRFGQLQLTSFQYRKYIKDISQNEKPGLEVDEPNPSTQFKVSTVSIEENQTGNNVNVPYRVPPGFQRDRDITTFNNVQLNEQSLSLCVENLRPGDARAVFKNTGYDLLSYNNLRLFLHLDSKSNTNIDGKASAFLRIGTDLSENYYEVEKVGLIASQQNSNPSSEDVWPDINELDLPFQLLRDAKIKRDEDASAKLNERFSLKNVEINGKFYNIFVVGRPDLSSVQTMMMGVRNNSNEDLTFCVWMNEMRVNGFNQTAGFAAVGKMNLKLADFAQVTITGAMKTFGFGGVQMRISERNRDIRTEYGIASNIAVDKLLPVKWGLQIPLFISYDKALITPKFDPLDPDMYLDDVALRKSAKFNKDYRRDTDDYTVRKGFNFANIRKIREGQSEKNHLYDIENFSLSYAYNETNRYNILMDDYTQRSYRGGLAYTYQNTPGIWEPFKDAKKMNRPSLAPIKDFNLSLAPSSITFRTDMDRSYIRTQLRNSELNTTGQAAMYEKYWLFNRLYDVNWNLSKSLILNYNAQANSSVDEPDGEIRNNETKLDSIRRNLWNLGRPKLFNQNITSTWRVPLDKFPLFDWMTADYSWKVGANYQAGSFGIKDSEEHLYGNIVRNNRDQLVTGKIDLVALYNKLKYLKFANSPDVKKVVIVQNPGAMEEIPENKSQVLKKFTRFLMAIRGINYTIAMQEATVLPGFLPQPKYFGLGDTYLNDKTKVKVSTMAPGLPFVLGSQNINILDKAEKNNWLTRSKEQNLPFTQTRTKRVEFRTQIEPVKDLQIQLEARWNRTDNYQEFFRPDSTNNGYKSISPVRSGNFSMSYLSFLTALKLTNSEGGSDNFDTFVRYRSNILKRKSVENEKGNYTLNSQDVLLPAFFAAYSGKDPNKVKLSPFRGIPLPNWRLNYKGLANIPFFAKWFTTLELSHAYSSTYSVGNFVSSLEYQNPDILRFNQDNSRVHFLGFDTNFGYPPATALTEEGLNAPVYNMSIISFTEKFGPFIGLNFRTKSKWTGRIEYNQDRNISLNLSNTSVSELINKDWVVNLGATKNNVRLPFKVNGKTVRLKNDMIFNCNFTLRDQRATLRKIEGNATDTAGQLMLQFRPQVQYAVDKKLSLSVYFDRMLNNPYVLTSFRRATTQGGIQIRYSLTP